MPYICIHTCIRMDMHIYRSCTVRTLGQRSGTHLILSDAVIWLALRSDHHHRSQNPDQRTDGPPYLAASASPTGGCATQKDAGLGRSSSDMEDLRQIYVYTCKLPVRATADRENAGGPNASILLQPRAPVRARRARFFAVVTSATGRSRPTAAAAPDIRTVSRAARATVYRRPTNERKETNTHLITRRLGLARHRSDR
jgi:hypothetical protein